MRLDALEGVLSQNTAIKIKKGKIIYILITKGRNTLNNFNNQIEKLINDPNFHYKFKLIFVTVYMDHHLMP